MFDHVRGAVCAVGVPLAVVALTLGAYAASGTPAVAEQPVAVPSQGTSDRPTETPSSTPTPTPTPPSPEPAGPAEAALAALDTLASAGPPAADYIRAAFGPGWGDPDRNGCDTRNDILARDLTDVVFRPNTNNCVVSTGVLQDPYTGTTIQFVRGNVTSEAVQIDHIVALGWAWRYGAGAWDESTRILFANDPDNLLAVDGPTNMGKSDSGPAEWMPPNEAFHCDYAILFVDVLVEYQLAVPAEDRSALERALESC